MDTEMIRRYVTLRDREKELGAAAASVKEEADALEQVLLDNFAEASIDSMRIDGKTVYLRRQVWASVAQGADKSDVLAGFRKAGLDHFVTENYNSQTVSAWMRELEASGEPLPEPLDALLEPVERFNIRVRRT